MRTRPPSTSGTAAVRAVVWLAVALAAGAGLTTGVQPGTAEAPTPVLTAGR